MFHCEQDLLSNLIVLSTNNARHKFRQYIFDAWDWKCAYCGEELTPETATIDHIIPKFKSGSSNRNNLIPACRNCNSDKGSCNMEEWYIDQIFYSDLRLLKIKDWMKESFNRIFYNELELIKSS